MPVTCASASTRPHVAWAMRRRARRPTSWPSARSAASRCSCRSPRTGRSRIIGRRAGADAQKRRSVACRSLTMEARALTEELIAYDTSTAEGIRLCAGFVKGWLEARDIVARQIGVRDLPVTIAEAGPADATRTLLLHGHVDVVPGRPEQFQPRLDGDRLYGRGAYDMKGALACLMLALADLRDQDRVRVRLGIVPDEESEEEAD